MPGFIVVYDACVLYPAPLRDFLIELASSGLFHAKWTDEIHEEWISNLLINRTDLTRENLERTKQLMDSAILDCKVFGYEQLIPAISCPDENDRHVIAAAVHARAGAIITFNLKDFPAETLSAYNTQALHPDEFITRQGSLDPVCVVMAAQRCRQRLKRPPMAADEYLDVMSAQGLTKTVQLLSQHMASL